MNHFNTIQNVWLCPEFTDIDIAEIQVACVKLETFWMSAYIRITIIITFFLLLF